MTSAISVLRKRWLALAAIVVLMAVALATGTLFAANERQQQPELPTVSQPSVMDATEPVAAVEPPGGSAPAPERVPAQLDDDKEAAGLPPIDRAPLRYSNLDSNLNRLVEQAEAAQQEADSADGSSGSVPPAKPVLVTFYVEPEQVATVRQWLEDNDVYVRNVGEDYIESHIPPALLPAASEQPGVGRVDTVIPLQPAQSQGNVVSQGVALHQADAWHNMGYRGQGVKVGVIDRGFEGFIQRQGSELPRNVTALCFFEQGRTPSSRLADCEAGGDHGTAVAETLIDVAPEIQLYIANVATPGDIQKAADWMAEQGVQVVNMSLVAKFDGPGDGTSTFSNSPLNTIDTAVSSGITWVNGAGNDGKNAWYGPFSDSDGNDFHEFESGDPLSAANYFLLLYRDSVQAFIRWDDEWGGADCNLDLYLARLYTDGYKEVLSDREIQNGENHDIPYASVSFQVRSRNEAGTYALFIKKENCVDVPAWVQLIEWDTSELPYYSLGHHIGNPAESYNAGMLAVGAAHWENTGSIASYSSRGPTIDGRTKPDITGIACGRSTVYPRYTRHDDSTECWFSGTSQAAPHVAGLAALVKQRAPDFSPDEVAGFLMDNAQERGSPGPDNTWGHGFATLPDPSLPVEIPPASPITNLAVQAGPGAGEATLSWDAVADATYYRIGYVNLEVDWHLAKASCTGEWIEAFVYVDVNARNIPVSDGRAEYTVRRLSEGARHAFTVLTSNDFADSGGGGSVSSEFFWPSNPRWTYLDGRRDLPPGVTIPPLDCPQ